MITPGRPIKRDMTTHLGVELDEFMVELENCGLSIGCWLVSSQLSSSSSEYKLINPSPDIFSKACLSWPVLKTSLIQIFYRKYTFISYNFVITKIYSVPRPMCRIPYFYRYISTILISFKLQSNRPLHSLYFVDFLQCPNKFVIVYSCYGFVHFQTRQFLQP